jgi:tetratricopeptide (TPR) repeat protein
MSHLWLLLLMLLLLILLLHSHFKNILEAIKFGNSAYYANDLNKALQNFDAMEATMKQLNNERGLGVVYANKANVLRLIKERHTDAEQCFAASIANAEKLLAAASSSAAVAAAVTLKEQQQLLDSRNALTVALGNRHMNRAVFKMEQSRYGEALVEFSTAMQLHRSTDNQTGLAMTSGNGEVLVLAL